MGNLFYHFFKLNQMADKPTLGYWKIRGLATNLRVQLAYQGVEYEMVEYEQGDGPEFSRQPWLDVKPNLGMDFPNLPYFHHGDLKISETMAIHKYIADAWKPEVLGKTAADKAHANMLAGVSTDLKMGTTMPCYTTGDKAQIQSAIDAKLPAIVNFLGGKQFLVGDYVTYIDFYFWELLNTLKFYTDGGVFTTFPTLQAYHNNVAGLPGVKEYLADPNCIEHKYTFNNKVAKINNNPNA